MRAVLLLSFYLIEIILLIKCPPSTAWRSFKIIFTQFDYEANPKLVDVKIQVQNSSDSSSLDIAVNVLEILEEIDLSVRIVLQTEQANYTDLINKSVNFCKIMKDRNAEPLVRIIYKDLAKHGKLFKECPVQKGSYSLRDYHLDEELLPSFLPETTFKFNIRLNNPKNELIFQGDLYGRIDKSKGFNNLKMFSLG